MRLLVVTALAIVAACGNPAAPTDSGEQGDANQAMPDAPSVPYEQYIKASNTGASDQFGTGLALSSDGLTMAIGARNEDSDARGINGDQTSDVATDSGAVYVFVKNGGVWTQQAYLKASNTDADDQFGLWVTLSSDGATLAVGAPGEASLTGDQTNNAAPNAGAVYVFTRTGGTWSQQAYLKASNPDAGDDFGVPVSLSSDGNILAVGANGEASASTGINKSQTSNAAPSAGAAYVFSRTGSAWSQQAYVKASNTDAGDTFGEGLALSGDGVTLAVAAPKEASNAVGVNGNQADNSSALAGAVYVFTRSGSTWSQQAYVKASQQGGKSFGSAVSLSNDGATLAIGAVTESSSSTGVNGNETDSSAQSSGAAYVFTRGGSTWSQQAYVKASNTDAGDRFGFGIALSNDGSTLSIGARDEDSSAWGLAGNQADNGAASSGATYVFQRASSVWSQRAYVKASNTGAGDLFGFGLALSGDGNELGATAIYESSSATGIDGDGGNDNAIKSGAAYVVTGY